MKLFLSILSIALVAQVSFAAGIHRSKRESENIFQAMINLVAEQKTIAEDVLKDLPSTPAYAKYKQAWEAFLKTYDEKIEGEVCFAKIKRLADGYGDFFPSYRSANANAEEKEMWRLFVKHGIVEFLDRQKTIFAKASDDIDLEQALGEC